MREAERLLDRLARIRVLESRSDARGAARAAILDELRALVVEADAWARLEGDERAHEAAWNLRVALASVDGASGEEVGLLGVGSLSR